MYNIIEEVLLGGLTPVVNIKGTCYSKLLRIGFLSPWILLDLLTSSLTFLLLLWHICCLTANLAGAIWYAGFQSHRSPGRWFSA